MIKTIGISILAIVFAGLAATAQEAEQNAMAEETSGKAAERIAKIIDVDMDKAERVHNIHVAYQKQNKINARGNEIAKR